MKDKFTVDFDSLASTLLPKKAHRLADVEGRIEKVAYDLVRYRDNDDTDQLWKIEEGADGPVIVALYGDDGGLVVESEKEEKTDWDAVPDKTAMHIYYKNEPIVTLSSKDLGISSLEFSLARKWLPKKLAADERLQANLLTKVASASRALIPDRFPELRKVVKIADEMYSTDREMFMKDPQFGYEQEQLEWEDETGGVGMLGEGDVEPSEMTDEKTDEVTVDDFMGLVDQLYGMSEEKQKEFKPSLVKLYKALPHDMKEEITERMGPQA